MEAKGLFDHWQQPRGQHVIEHVRRLVVRREEGGIDEAMLAEHRSNAGLILIVAGKVVLALFHDAVLRRRPLGCLWYVS
jgi:hypothetical protein